MKTLAVVNPRSANGRTGREWPDLERRIAARLGPFETCFTRGPLDASALVRDGLRRGFDRILSVGGDGAHSEAVDGFFDGDRPINPDAVLATIPRGTVRTLDCGRLSFVGHEGEERRRYFINIASFGIGGLVDEKVNRASKALGGAVSFLVGTLRAFAEYKNARVEISVDGGPWEELLINNVAVANGQYFGGGMWVAPRARMDDGLFDVVAFGDVGLGTFLARGYKLYSGTHLGLPFVTFRRARKVAARSDERVLLDVDGEQPGRLPATIEIVPAAIRAVADPP